MDSFWDKQIKRGLSIKIRNAKLKSKNPSTDWKLMHQDWINSAKTNDYTMLIKTITQQEKNRVALAMQRREKLRGQN